MSSLEFLSPAGAAGHVVARSPMERAAQAAGARFEVRDGWNVAVGYGREVPAGTVGWADVSHGRKHELLGPREALERLAGEHADGGRLELGSALRARGAWWCPVTPERVLVLGDAEPGEAPGVHAADMTTAYAALTLVGPLAREAFARFCALDLRDASCSVGAFRPGSVARTPGFVLRESGERFLVLVGWALGAYLWEQVADAAGHLGGAPLGLDALVPLEETLHA